MARRETEVTIEKDQDSVPANRRNRDAGKTFVLTEWPADQAEDWANRAILAVGNSGARIDYIQGLGMAGIAALGFKALFGINDVTALQLINELMQCVKIKEQLATRPVTPDDIEEVTTRWHLKREVFTLHTGFSWAELQSKLSSATHLLASYLTPTPPEPSAKPSPPVEPVLPN